MCKATPVITSQIIITPELSADARIIEWHGELLVEVLEEIVPGGILPGHLTYFKRRDK